MSTVKVYGEANIGGKPFTETDTCNPQDAYGQSKLNAENALTALESPSFKVSIVRSPLVYGPGVKGNMQRLIKLAKSPFPLGFKGIDNKRTMVFVDNLVALIDRIIENSQPGIFLAADDQPVSTSDAIVMLRKAMMKRANVFRLPRILLSLIGIVAPKLKTRLFGSLVFNNEDTKKRLNFHNPYSTEEGFRLMITDRSN
jgi:UDP-glucose 4-epimerase